MRKSGRIICGFLLLPLLSGCLACSRSQATTKPKTLSVQQGEEPNRAALWDWLTNWFKTIDEPFLHETDAKHAYRVIWSPARYRYTIIARLNVKSGGAGLLTTKILDSNKEGADRTVRSEQRSLSVDEVNHWLSLLEAVDFWKMSTFDEEMGVDGATWLLEGVRDGKHHVVERWSPRRRDAYRRACMYLLSKVRGSETRGLYED